jgi:hypothetical protein
MGGAMSSGWLAGWGDTRRKTYDLRFSHGLGLELDVDVDFDMDVFGITDLGQTQ